MPPSYWLPGDGFYFGDDDDDWNDDDFGYLVSVLYDEWYDADDEWLILNGGGTLEDNARSGQEGA